MISSVVEKPKQPAAAPQNTTFKPHPPQTLEEAGLSPELVDSLLLKQLLTYGASKGAQLAETLALAHTMVVDRLAQLKQQQLVGYVGAGSLGDFTYTLSETGRDRARTSMKDNMYIGSAPVSFADYCKSVEAQSITLERPNRERLELAFSDLLINDHMFQTLGPAINSGRGMFLHGFPGNGKTSIAERITKCFGNEIYIPKAIHVHGHIINLFDAEIHHRLSTAERKLFKADQVDERWVRITRPTVIAGGELTMDQLEVRYNTTTKISEAPMQLKSNCGTLVIDDFGRQRMNPFELLNRWIVPLEKRFDFLGLANGQKIQVPFDQLLIFATNLEPRDLVDEAFLRRIPYKINVIDPTEDEYRELFRMMCRIVEVECREDIIDYVIEKHYRKADRPFRACQPRDLITLAKTQCEYEGRTLKLTRENLDFAAECYFTVME
jgi:predicted ATPase with chaperone activity